MNEVRWRLKRESGSNSRETAIHNENDSNPNNSTKILPRRTPDSRNKPVTSTSKSDRPMQIRTSLHSVNRFASPVHSSSSLNKSDSFETTYSLRVAENAAELSFQPEAGYAEYKYSSFKARKEYIVKHVKCVKEYNDNYAVLHMEFLKRIEKDPQLKNWKYGPSDKDISDRFWSVLLAKRTHTGLLFSRPAFKNKSAKHKKNSLKEVSAAFEMYLNSQDYVPPKQRIRISKNLTMNRKDSLPVYSDVPGEQLSQLYIPTSLLYDYDDRNRLHALAEPELHEVYKKSLEKEHMIKCNCCSSDSVVSCFDNENCPCYRMNRKLQRLQTSETPTSFSTFEPILLDKLNQFYEFAGFACSEECSCMGNCTNNSLLISQKKIFPFELFRENMEVGFSVRSYIMIPAGVPIMEFVGEIVEEKLLEEGNKDYAYQIVYPEPKWISLLESMDWPKDFKKKIIDVSSNNYYLDPKLHGNVSRTVCHSCTANTEVVRIYQKGLTPAHLHLMLVTVQDIYPGTPITMDYGKRYVEDMLMNKCKCGTFACHNGEYAKLFKNLNVNELCECFKRLNKYQFEKWSKQVWKQSDRNH